MLGQNPAWRHILLGFHVLEKKKRAQPSKPETVFSGCPHYPLLVTDSDIHLTSQGPETLVLCHLLKESSL